MSDKEYGPLAFLIGKWDSGPGWTGQNRAPDPDRKIENTRFKQLMTFEPIGQVDNHEQTLYGLRYSTIAWEEGNADPFHEEVGYWIWDSNNQQVMKSFIVPRGISVNAGGTAKFDAKSFTLEAIVGSDIYGICSNPFLDKEFKTIRYILNINQTSDDSFTYSEDSQIKILGQTEIFHHTEKNTMTRV